MHIDENLSWNMHIEKIAKEIASSIGAIKRCRPFVNQTTLESVFNALVQPYFNYCSEVWGHCNKSLSNKLQKLQNRAARILTFSSYDTSADPLFELLNGDGWILSDKYKWPPWSINPYMVLRPTILVLFSLNMIHLII